MADRRQQSGPKSDVVAMRDALDQSLGELDLVYGIEPRLKDEKTGRARLTLLLRMLTRFLDMSYAVLMVPTRNVRIAVTHKNWQNVDRQLIDERLLRDVLPKFAQETTPRLLQLAEVPHGAEGRGGRYQMLLQPVRAADGQAIGMMALMCQTQGRPLSIVAKRLLTHFTHVAQRVIEASFDPLTGFMRRDDFDALVAEGVVLASQREEPWALLYFDVDRLQVANDTFNQSAGDEVLQRFARLLEDETPQGTPLARLGGDKFSVLLRGFDIVHAVELAERIRGACTALEVARNGHVFPVTVSGGIVSLNDRRAREKGPLVVAKMAAIKAKDHGGNRVECFNEADLSIVRRVDNLDLFSRLQQAISKSLFQLFAQPIRPVNGDEVAPHFEILLRLPSDQGVVLQPDQFFAAAEHYQLMPKLDRWVLRNFFATVAKVEDCLALHEASFAINLSGQSLGDPTFQDYVREQVENSLLQPRQLCFEITETAAISNRGVALDFMHAMRKIGCRFALDDFGSGLSSFAYLRDMPVDVLKIDGSFVQDLHKNKVSAAMVAAVAQVAKVMDLVTVAEYVENEEILTRLQELDVDYGQGYLLGHPEPLVQQLEGLMDAPLADGLVINFTDRLEITQRIKDGTY